MARKTLTGVFAANVSDACVWRMAVITLCEQSLGGVQAWIWRHVFTGGGILAGQRSAPSSDLARWVIPLATYCILYQRGSFWKTADILDGPHNFDGLFEG